jgi:hypothetical protein
MLMISPSPVYNQDVPPPNDGWPEVWAKMTDSEIEESLQDYLWLAANTPNSHARRIDQLLGGMSTARQTGDCGSCTRACGKAGELTQPFALY